jgi:hypothetical protein
MRQLGCPPSLEVLGTNLSAFLVNLQADETRPIMQRHGLDNIQQDKWYPAHKWMEALNQLAREVNLSSNLVAIGMEIGKIVPMPPGVENPDLPQVLTLWDGVYQYLHRNGDAGKIVCEKVNDKHYTTTHTDLYPDDFTYGIIYGYAKRFLPPGTRFKVFYDEKITPRDRGGTGPTVIHVSWE